jgi:hypothetical protein
LRLDAKRKSEHQARLLQKVGLKIGPAVDDAETFASDGRH